MEKLKDFLHRKDIEISVKRWEYPKVCVNLQTDVR